MRTTARGTYPHHEISFMLLNLPGNPFDFRENDVMATIRKPDRRTVKLPAFYDGRETWKVRYTPDLAGAYSVARITLNGRAVKPGHLHGATFMAKGAPQPGFVRRDARDRTRFAFDNGDPYYPIGCNVAWGDENGVSVTGVLGRLGAAGGNWARIWMDHWDRKNLDWVPKKVIPSGHLDLEVAAHWDKIVSAAEQDRIRFQMVLQHHGPYSSTTDSNWGENPWNAANGGFLATPEEFFTSPRAKALTKAKYRYIIARWGYSPSIMAWELFNEVQWTDAVKNGRRNTVAAWHNEMADFVRKQDPYRHLVTSSSEIDPSMLGNRLDYWQPHAYIPDPLPVVSRIQPQAAGRPAFVGEIGTAGGTNPDEKAFLHRALWGSLMSESSGSAQYWSWYVIDHSNLYGQFRPVTEFIRWSGITSRRGLRPVAAQVVTQDLRAVHFSPGAGWAAARQTEFTVLADGTAAGVASMPSFLQGETHREMFPQADFHVDYPAPGTFSISIAKASKAGARVSVSLDGNEAAQQEFPAAGADTDVNATLKISVPAGAHTIRVRNTGADWAVIQRITLDPYTRNIGVLGRHNRDFAALWVYSSEDAPTRGSGTLTVEGCTPGEYRVVWWDTTSGKPVGSQDVMVKIDGLLSTVTPVFQGDVAARISRTKS